MGHNAADAAYEDHMQERYLDELRKRLHARSKRVPFSASGTSFSALFWTANW